MPETPTTSPARRVDVRRDGDLLARPRRMRPIATRGPSFVAARRRRSRRPRGCPFATLNARTATGKYSTPPSSCVGLVAVLRLVLLRRLAQVDPEDLGRQAADEEDHAERAEQVRHRVADGDVVLQASSAPRRRRPSRPIASPAVPIEADSVQAPASTPAAVPTSRSKIFAAATVASRPVTQTTTQRRIGASTRG